MDVSNIKAYVDKATNMMMTLHEICEEHGRNGKRILTVEKSKQIRTFFKDFYDLFNKVVTMHNDEKCRAEATSAALATQKEIFNQLKFDIISPVKDLVSSVSVSEKSSTQNSSNTKTYSQAVKQDNLVDNIGASPTDNINSSENCFLKNLKHLKDNVISRNRTVVIKPVQSNTLFHPDDIRKQLSQKINCKQLGIKIDKVFPTKKNNLIIKANSEDHASKLIDSITHDKDLKALISTSRPRYKLSKVLLLKVPSFFTEIQVIDFLAEEFSVQKSLFTLKKFGQNSTMFCNYLLVLPMDFAVSLLSKGKILFDFHTIFVKDFLSITRCFRCQRYGHTINNCTYAPACGK